MTQVGLIATMKPVLKGKVRLLVEFSFFGIAAGIMYQLINEKRLDENAFIAGFFLGFFDICYITDNPADERVVF